MEAWNQLNMASTQVRARSQFTLWSLEGYILLSSELSSETIYRNYFEFRDAWLGSLCVWGLMKEMGNLAWRKNLDENKMLLGSHMGK